MFKLFIYEERLEPQKLLKESPSLKEISRRLSKEPTTIPREVHKYSLGDLNSQACILNKGSI